MEQATALARNTLAHGRALRCRIEGSRDAGSLCGEVYLVDRPARRQSNILAEAFTAPL